MNSPFHKTTNICIDSSFNNVKIPLKSLGIIVVSCLTKPPQKTFYPFNKKYHKEGVGVVVITNAQLLSTSLNTVSAQVQILLTACQRFAMMRISLTIVPAGNIAKCLFSVNSTIPQKQFIIIIIIISYGISTESFLKSHFLVKP